MNKRQEWIFLIGVAVFLVAVLAWPLRYPAQYSDKEPDLSGSITVTRDKSLEDKQIISSRNLAGVAFWTTEEPKVSKDTFLEVYVSDPATGKNIVSKAEKFSDVFSKSEKTLRFTFPTTKESADGTYTVSLRMPDASSEESLSVKGPLKNSEDKTSAEVLIQPIEKRSFISILGTRLYKADADGEDIYYYWARGGEVAKGNNPYICALDDTCINHKNPGHFPLFYWLSAFSRQAGFDQFEDWIAFWRPMFILCYVITGGLLFGTLFRRKQYELALFALFFWLFNRWSLYVIRVAHVDFLAIVFLVASVVLFEKRKFWSSLLFGLSLATKQVAIFLTPLYVILVWVKTEKEKRLMAVMKCIAIMAIVPVITSLPFLLDNPKGVVKGLLFSASRTSEANMGAAPLVSLLKIQGAVGVAPMVFLMVLIYLAAYRKKISLATGGLAIMLIFIAFNTVIFNQYFLWFVPFLPLAIAELGIFDNKKTTPS